MNTSSPPAIQLRARLRMDRERAGLKQREVAASLGVTSRQVMRWEAGDGLPTRDHRRALEQLLSRPVGYYEPTDDGGAEEKSPTELARLRSQIKKLERRLLDLEAIIHERD